MSNPNAAKIAAAAAEYARRNPTPTNVDTANALLVDAVRIGATGEELRDAGRNIRR